MKLLVVSGTLALALGLSLAPTRPTEKERALPDAPLYDVANEIYALRYLYYFRFTRDQLLQLRKLSKETAAPPREHAAGKGSEDYRRLLSELRAALIAADDSDRIDDVEEKVFDITESERPEVDDVVEITPAARKRSVEVLRWLKPNQLAGYFALMAEDVSDPADELVASLEAIRGQSDADWKQSRDSTANELAWLGAGLDDRKRGKLADSIAELLTTAKELKDEEFAARKAALEKRARKLIGEMDPGVVLRNHTLFVLSDLLSNPRLEAAIDARLQPKK